MSAPARILAVIFVALAATCAMALGQATAPVHVHGHVLAVPSPDNVIAAIDARPGSPAQTRRYTITGNKLRAGDEFDASLDTKTATLENVVSLTPLATMPPAHLVTNGSAQSQILDSIVFVLGVLILGGILAWITKRVIIDERH